MWLQDFFLKDNNLKYCRTMTFGYNTKYRAKEKRWIEDHVENLLTEVNKARSTKAEQRRPLVLIGHSFGGTIITHAFVKASTGTLYTNIYNSVRGIFFFGVPFKGINLEDVFSMLDDDEEIGKEDYELVRGIVYETERFTNTATIFKERIEGTKTRVFSFYETHMTPKVIKLPDGSYGRHGDHVIVVSRNSVELGISGLEELFSAPANHSTIVKFKNEQDPTYRTVHDRLKELVQSAEAAAIQGLEKSQYIVSKDGIGDINTQRDKIKKIKEINFVIPFDLPLPRNRNFVGRVEKLAQVHEHFSEPNVSDTPRFFALVGTGGMGKTQIAIEYAYRHRHNYTAIFWVSAASEDTIRTSFINIMQRIVKEQARITWPESSPDYQAIGSKLRIPGLINQKGTISANLEAVDNIRSALFNWLQMPGNNRWILIFDNADDLETFDLQRYFPNSGDGAILVTSRRPEFSHRAEQVSLEGLDDESAIKLLLDLAQLPSSPEDLSAIKAGAASLVAILGFMPLAISHAGCYIYETKLPLGDYLLYYNKAFMAVQSRKPRFGWNYRNDTAATTWEISFSKIEEQDKEAALLLLVCSYLNPEEISNSLWEDELADKIEIENKILLLASYSLAKVMRFGLFSVHPVVHMWARERSDRPGRFKTMRHAVTILGKASQRVNVSRESNEWKAQEERIIASHLEYLHQYSKPLFPAFPLKEQGFEDQMLFDYFHNIALVFYNQGKHDEAMQWYERALSGKEKAFGRDHPSTLNTVNNIALVFDNQGKHDEAMKLYWRAFTGYETALGKDHPLTLKAVHNIAGAFDNQRKYDEAMKWYERALTSKEKACGRNHPSTLSIINDIAGVFFNEGKYDEAMKWYERAFTSKEKAFGRDHPSTLNTIKNIAGVFLNQDKHNEAMQWYKRALAGYEMTLGKDHPSTLDTVHNIALVFYKQGKYDEAIQWYEQALAGKDKAFGRDHPSTLDTVHNIALVFDKQDKYDEAIQWYKQALAGKDKAFGRDHPSTLNTVHNIALAFDKQNKYDEAIQWYEQALAGKEKVFGRDHLSILGIVNNIALIFDNKGKHDDAMQWYKRALAGYEEVLGKDHFLIFNTVDNIALAFRNQGEYDKAIQQYERALAGYEMTLGKDHPSTLDTIHNIALVFDDQDKYDEAMQWYERALSRKEKVFDRDHPSILSTVSNIAGIFLRQDKYNEAMQWYKRALAGYKITLGEDHPLTLQTAEFLHTFTENINILEEFGAGKSV
ncbi:hypothetical protein TWF481_010371 [Arthrobotrys musiformis]|uniref:NB-ARC domain-containing protein n=1 Tax=Arthrobotrys musiformis TaxID=47236 RepID=A0AAV9W0R6_9PEZI